MKVLSLLQPWATLVVTGYKKLETRSWTTAYRGRLLIHAGKGRGGAALAAAPAIRAFIPDFNSLSFGAIIGEVTLHDIIRLPLAQGDPDALTLEEKAFGTYDSGRYGWILTDPVSYDEPIPATGRLGLWEF